jgi:hypothetical protein
METYEKMEIQLYAFLTFELDGDNWSSSCPRQSTNGRYPFNRRLGGPQRQSGHSKKKKRERDKTSHPCQETKLIT